MLQSPNLQSPSLLELHAQGSVVKGQEFQGCLGLYSVCSFGAGEQNRLNISSGKILDFAVAFCEEALGVAGWSEHVEDMSGMSDMGLSVSICSSSDGNSAEKFPIMNLSLHPRPHE